MKRLAVDVQPGDYSIVRLPAGAALPAGLLERSGRALVSVTSTPDEVSMVCPTEMAPSGENLNHGWRLLTVRGPLEFTLTGIMAAIAGALAAAGVSLFAVSTYNTDHVLVKDADVGRAIDALTEAGHEITDHSAITP
jgi:hypothetical protein